MNEALANEIVAMLTIVEQCVGHSGKLSSISGAAMTRLLEINEELRQEGIAAATGPRAVPAESETTTTDEPTDETQPLRRL